MDNQEKKCIKLQEDYRELVQAKEEFDGLLEKIQGKKKEMGKNMSKVKFDIEEAKVKKQEIRNKLIEIQEQMDQVITGVYEGVEKKISLNEQIKYWNKFYQDYEIKDEKGEICQVSRNLRLTPEALVQAKRDIEKIGFDMILIIPESIKPIDLLNNDKLLTFKENKFDKQGNRKKVEDKRFIDIGISADILNIPISQTQIILLTEHPDVYQDDNWDSRNKKFQQVQDKEKDLKVEGLDIFSFLFFHRYYYDEHNDTHANDWGENNATWLTKAVEKEQCTEVGWDPDCGMLKFFCLGTDSCLSFLGAVFSRRLETAKRN